MSLRLPIQWSILLITFWSVLPFVSSAQLVNISLHATAVPDSFEVRAQSTGATISGLTYATFTIRWEASAGGEMNNGDIAAGCSDYSVANYGGVIEILEHRYFPINIEPKWPSTGCEITSTPQPIAGVRIRELAGCRNVELVSNAFTWVNNLSYWMSVAGLESTGEVTSGPIGSGDCPPCEPPQILDISASALPICLNYPLDLAVEATGTTLSYSWTAPNDTMPFQYLPAFTVPVNTISTAAHLQAGIYQVIVSNYCGSATGEIEVIPDSAMCVAPVIDSAWYEPPTQFDQSHRLRMTVDGTCLTNTWYPSPGTQGSSQHVPSYIVPGPVSYFMVISSNQCGADTAFVNVDPDGWCIPPSIDSVWYTAGTGSSNLSLNANIDGTYMTHQWIFPSGNMGTTTNGSLNVPNAPTGTYTLISTNPCGSDTAWIDVNDIAPCAMPVINSISATPSIECIQASVLFSVSMTSPNPKTYKWFGPDDTLLHNSASSFTIPAAPQGWYVFVGTNNCGSISDSVQVAFDTDTVGCIPPQILSIASNAPICEGDTLVLEAEVIVGEGCAIYDWSGNGVIESGGPSTTAPGGTGNNYGLIITNACGSASLTVSATIHTVSASNMSLCGPTTLVDLDSLAYNTQLDGVWFHEGEEHSKWYDPAVDTSGHYLHYNGMGCLTESLHLTEWPAVNAGQDTSIITCSNVAPFALFPFLGGDPDTTGFWSWGLSIMDGIFDPDLHNTNDYRYHVNNFGCSDMATVHVTEITPTTLWEFFCGPPNPVNLDSLTGNTFSGTWYHNEIPHSGTYYAESDTSGNYQFIEDDLGCLIIDLDLDEFPGVNAGEDTAVTVCSIDAPFSLFDLLGGDPDDWGSWSFWISTMNGIYDPAIHFSNTYTYQVAEFACSDQSHIVVTELEATPWYSDQDGDGFGDPAETIMECDQPDGTVADASDDCPLLFGLIGDECDDGLEGTINDVITADCECVGELTTGLIEIGTSATLIWPNPNSGDRIFVQLPFEERSATIEITDAVGRIVHRSEAVGSASLFVIEMEHRLNAGSYFVKIVAGEHMLIEKLVIER